ncbi:Lipid A core-O-antigen ligase and related enzymes [Bordetella ansorpii]|uniref:Lipid A core-O-antigen ligase and related enzymes n=1 Tax=Bordetella ansorpii TaxID=288768 RepID=A0A157S986_9BORD|nr:hypothetical protein [Bordetella ansorpii]SAI66803.1 Lipid A core-O-antigen ligase and related enzymes [Bordetella ansorpii]
MEEAKPDGRLPAIFSTEPVRSRVRWWLVILLPLFGQTFHYMTDIRPLWALSKAFPLLSLPLALRLMSQARFPVTRQLLLSFAWLLLVPSLASMVYFNESFFTSITAQVKLLPFLYFFSFLALLQMLRPTLYELERSFVALGITVAVVLIVLWIAVPSSWYKGTYVVGTAPLFSDDSRGHRIRMSMYFPIILLFFCYRRAFFERSGRYLLGVVILFAITLLIIKTRAMILGIAGVLAINTLLWASPRARLGLAFAVPFLLASMFSVDYLASVFDTSAKSGFDVRRTSIELATRFLGDNPLGWLFGVGTISPTSSQSLMKYFHHFFFLADITWLGIVFEYGLFGAVLFILIELRGLRVYRQLRAHIEDDLLGALSDYLIYVLLISFLYPLTLTPGESAVILAVFVYVWRASGLENSPSSVSSPAHA